MQLIQTVTVGSGGSASIVFSSIPQIYTDLCLVLSLRGNRANQNEYAQIRPNGLTTNLSVRLLFGTGSGVGSNTDGPQPAAIVNGNNATTNTFSNSLVYIGNYAGSTAKSMSIDSTNENNGTDSLIGVSLGLWNSSSALTSLELHPVAGGTTWLQYSSASLYGIKSGSDGVTTVS